MGPMRHNGLAFANAMASSVNCLLLFYFLRKKLGGLGTRRIALSFIKTFSASAVMGFAGWFLAGRYALWTMVGHGLNKAAYLGTIMVFCAGVYAATAYLIKSEELGYIIKKIRSRNTN